LYRATAQFYGSDCDHNGFRWVDLHNADESIWAFSRRAVGGDAGAPITCVFNATPVPRDNYGVGVSELGSYQKIFDSDDVRFGGSGYNKQSHLNAAHDGAQGYPHSLRLSLPPLGAVFFIGPV
jgi:1,4-alpha-glucan branching enzyme